jgi:hypothetical protein
MTWNGRRGCELQALAMVYCGLRHALRKGISRLRESLDGPEKAPASPIAAARDRYKRSGS